ncbi:MAG: 50S ribosomal protein L18 [Acidobacteriota bacterium]
MSQKLVKPRERIKRRIRKKIRGTAKRPRLSVFRSLRNIYIQLIDDDRGVTLAAASSLEKELRSQLKTGGNMEAARRVAELMAERIKSKKVKTLIFDRSGYKYHGLVKKVAETLREKGLIF